MQRGMWLFVMAAALGLLGRSSYGESSDSYTSDLSTRTRSMLLIDLIQVLPPCILVLIMKTQM